VIGDIDLRIQRPASMQAAVFYLGGVTPGGGVTWVPPGGGGKFPGPIGTFGFTLGVSDAGLEQPATMVTAAAITAARTFLEFIILILNKNL